MPSIHRFALRLATACVLFGLAANAAFAQPAGLIARLQPTEPDQAEKTFSSPNGFRLELLAAEPLVSDPVAVVYDENGRAWVAEMGDYPYSDKSLDRHWEEQPSLPLGRIRILEDTDGDGRFDTCTLFAEDLSWPTGLALWKGGVFVTATPDILYLKDTDGDGRADLRRTVFTGFRKFNVQAVINNLQWGLDHKIYGAGSSNGGTIRKGGDPSAPEVRMSRSDFRFDPVTEELELLAGGARYGNSFDDWGNRFICNIRNPVQHVVIENRYLARNPYLPARTGVQDAAEAGIIPIRPASPPEPWRVVSAERRANDPDDPSPDSEKIASGYITSSSGITIYRGAAYPEEYVGNAFVGEVAGNLILRYALDADGPTFHAMLMQGETEFLASTDNWFRPVNFVNAPDGTLHVVDMYRETIEHPWSIPDDIREQLDLRSGHEKGRLYRLVPPRYREGFTPPPKPQLGNASTEELVAHLANPNAWWRETSQRLIFERQDPAAVDSLRSVLETSSSPLARLHALWSLSGFGSLTDNDLQQALADPSAGVREHALRLTEPRLKESPELLALVARATRDDDRRVRFQAALSLGEHPDDAAGPVLSGLLLREADDSWMQTAILSSLTGSPAGLLLDLLGDREFRASTPGQTVLAQLAFMSGLRVQFDELEHVFAVIAQSELPTDVAFEIIKGIGTGVQRRQRSLRDVVTSGTEAGELIDRFLTRARAQAGDREMLPEARQAAVELLAMERFAAARAPLLELIESTQPQAVQLAAVRTLAGFIQPEIAALLLDRYPIVTPDVRRELVNALLARTDRTVPLLEAIEAKAVSAALIPSVRRTLLMQSSHVEIRERATRLFGSDVESPRNEVIAAYQPALTLPADIARGETVFKKECANCHKLGQAGIEVGPNLSTVRHRSPGELLVHILDPNREVSPSFMEYAIALTDGRIVTGMIAAESPVNLTLRGPERKETTILRSEIDVITDTGKSLMPEGLEKKLTPQEMADLLEFLLRSPLN